MYRIFFFFFLVGVELSAFEIPVKAKSALLMNADTGKVLFEKNASEKSYPASLTKVATALYVLERKELDFFSLYTPSRDALSVVYAKKKQKDFASFPPHILEHDGVSMGIQLGEELPVWTLLYGSLVSSCNDATNALAEASSGSVAQFVKELNDYLVSIGCTSTSYVNPHGLHNPEHVTCAYDLAIIARKALQNPHFRQIVQFKSFELPATNKRTSQKMYQSNQLIKPGKFYYPYAIGMKIGYTKKAQNNLIAAAEKNGRCLIAVILGCPNIERKYQDAVALFERAFAEKKTSLTLLPMGKVFSKKIEGADQLLEASLIEEVKVSFYPSEKGEYKAYVYWENLSLPIKPGAKVGRVCLKDQGNLVVEKPLFSKKRVKYSFWGYLKSFFHS